MHPSPAVVHSRFDLSEVVRNIIVGLTVSFVALSLGAALGILSGRGAFAGMLSAGLIALITSAFGGTRVQCSGPTAPMSAVSAIVVAYATETFGAATGILPPHQFINLVFFVSGVVMLLMALLRLGRFITLVPNVVISGFMSGISLLIWQDQFDALFGLGGKTRLGGPMATNIAVAAGTVGLIFLLAPFMRHATGRLARYLPSTLLSIVIMTATSRILSLPIETVSLGAGSGGLLELVAAQIPSTVNPELLLAALPFALQLALLCYLDTLLTSLVVDKISRERTRQDRELMAQGLANGAVSFFGGIPGAQATIRSVLMLKENATLRLSGIMVGVFVLIEMVLFRDLISLIPKAVFVGVLVKVGYDVFDFLPIRLYLKAVSERRMQMFRNFFSRHDDQPIFVTNREMLMIIGTALVTVMWNLNAAVGGFTALFYLHNRVVNRRNPMRDLVPDIETDGFAKQN